VFESGKLEGHVTRILARARVSRGARGNLNVDITFQRSQVLGNKIEMEITQLVEQNPTLLRLGLHLEFNDARHRVAAHLQRNIDRSKYTKNRRDVPTVK